MTNVDEIVYKNNVKLALSAMTKTHNLLICKYSNEEVDNFSLSLHSITPYIKFKDTIALIRQKYRIRVLAVDELFADERCEIYDIGNNIWAFSPCFENIYEEKKFDYESMKRETIYDLITAYKTCKIEFSRYIKYNKCIEALDVIPKHLYFRSFFLNVISSIYARWKVEVELVDASINLIDDSNFELDAEYHYIENDKWKLKFPK